MVEIYERSSMSTSQRATLSIWGSPLLEVQYYYTDNISCR